MNWIKYLLLLVCFTSLSAYSNNNIEYVSIRDTVPYFTVSSNRGRLIDVRNVGKPLLICFFHTDCYDCRKELPKLQSLYEKYKSRVEFICISRGEAYEQIYPFWEKHCLTLPFSAQNDKVIFKKFASRIIPRIYLIDEDGIVRNVFKERFSHRRLEKSIMKIVN